MISRPSPDTAKVPSADFAPIVLFVHGRPEHTRRTLAALAANYLATSSDLIIFADGPKGPEDEGAVAEVRALVKGAEGFARVRVVERPENFGLARNIIEGVTQVVGERGKVIVLEDDLVTSPSFLTFMNQALARYEEDPRVWHISGWNYPIDPSGLEGAFFWRAMNCWGWATWGDRWRHFERDPRRLVTDWNQQKIRRFNIDGAYDFWSQVEANHAGVKRTWAIFWYAAIFERGGLCLNPSVSFVRNIGHDGSGSNCGADSSFAAQALFEGELRFPTDVEESALALARIRRWTGSPRRRLRSWVGGLARRLGLWPS
ncbi:MAG: glycosyltransferase [Zoogloeaceae bacterium]|nr:glycosyltransferase [Zoogloeaceae bacterium]